MSKSYLCTFGSHTVFSTVVSFTPSFALSLSLSLSSGGPHQLSFPLTAVVLVLRFCPWPGEPLPLFPPAHHLFCICLFYRLFSHRVLPHLVPQPAALLFPFNPVPLSALAPSHILSSFIQTFFFFFEVVRGLSSGYF